MGRKPKLQLKELLLDILKKSEKPITTEDLRTKTGASWNTLQKYLETLHKEGKVQQIRIPGKVNLWFKKD